MKNILLILCLFFFLNVLNAQTSNPEPSRSLHIMCSSAIYIGSYTLINKYSNVDEKYKIIYPLLITLGTGYLKELYDMTLKTNGFFDPRDIHYDVVGLGIGIFFTLDW